MEVNEDIAFVKEVKSASKKKQTTPTATAPIFKKTKQARLSFTSAKKKLVCTPPTSKEKENCPLDVTLSDKKRKLSGSCEDLAPSAKKPSTNRCHVATDDEVSSSCDEAVLNSKSSGKSSKVTSELGDKKQTKKEKTKCSMLQKFVRREPTQQDEISTSVSDEVIEKSSLDDDSGDCAKESHTDSNVLEKVEKVEDEVVSATKKENAPRTSSRKTRALTVSPVKSNKKRCLTVTTPKSCKVVIEKMAPNALNSPRSKKSLISSFAKSAKKSEEDKTDDDDKEEGEMKAKACNSSIESAINESTTSQSESEKSVSSPSVDAAIGARRKLTPKALKIREDKKKQREEERKQKEEEKKKMKEEKDKLKREKEEERIRLKKEKEEEIKKAKEEKEKKRLLEIEMKNKEKEEKRMKAEEEKRLKEEERKIKEEEKRLKEEDKLKKEEEKKRAEQEIEEKKKKAAAKFANFFVASKTETPKVAEVEEVHTGPFMQMQVGKYTALAPICRTTLTKDAIRDLDESLSGESESRTYVSLLRDGKHVPMKTKSTARLERKPETDDCVIIEEKDEDEEDEDEDYDDSSLIISNKDPSSLSAKMLATGVKGKLLQFSENNRPAYWGTWSKKPRCVTGRKPFAQEEIFDYDYESDDDWEEEDMNDCESLHDSDNEKENEVDEEDNYEVDNDFFVPHGYLSDNEGEENDNDEEEGEQKSASNADEEEENEEQDSATKSDNKEKLKAAQAEFEKELKRQTKQLKPRVYGCLWLNNEQEMNSPAHEHMLRVLSNFSSVVCVTPPPSPPLEDKETKAPPVTMPLSWYNSQIISSFTPITTLPLSPPPTPAKPVHLQGTPLAPESAGSELPSTNSKRRFAQLPEEAVPDLIRLIHGNRNNRKLLKKEFQMYLLKNDTSKVPASTVMGTPTTANCVTNTSIHKKMMELAEYKKCPDEAFKGTCMWYVSAEVREQYNLSDLTLPNTWKYVSSIPTGRTADENCSDNVKTPSQASCSSTTPTSATKAVSLITKFTKILTDEDKEALVKKTAAPVAKETEVKKPEVISLDDDCDMETDDVNGHFERIPNEEEEGESKEQVKAKEIGEAKESIKGKEVGKTKKGMKAKEEGTTKEGVKAKVPRRSKKAKEGANTKEDGKTKGDQSSADSKKTRESSRKKSLSGGKTCVSPGISSFFKKGNIKSDTPDTKNNSTSNSKNNTHSESKSNANSDSKNDDDSDCITLD